MSDRRERLDEFGIPVDAITEGIAETVAAANAMQHVIKTHPYVGPREAELSAYIQSHADVAARVARIATVDPLAAMDTLANSHRAETGGRSGDTAPGRSGQANTPHGRTPEQQEAWEAYQRTGSKMDAQRYAHARLHDVVSDDFLRQ